MCDYTQPQPQEWIRSNTATTSYLNRSTKNRKKPAPSYIINEIEFFRFIEEMIDGWMVTDDDIIEYYEECFSVPYSSVYGKTPISTLLSYCDGIYFDQQEQCWYADEIKFANYITKLHEDNKKEYGENYDRADRVYLFDKTIDWGVKR